MKRFVLPILASPFVVPVVFAKEPAIERLDLFKNGIAIVHVNGATDEDGRATLDPIPQPTHGTFRLHADKPMTAKIELREEEVRAMPGSSVALLRQLAGESVTLHLSDEVAVSGQLMEAEEEGHQPIILKTDFGYEFVEPGQIKRVQFQKAPELVSSIKSAPTLTFASEGAADFSLTYLTRGISWMPSYFIDLSDPETLKLSQKAVIRNEMADFEDVELRLISGYPSIKFGDMNSSFAPLGSQTEPMRYSSRYPQSSSFSNDLATQMVSNSYSASSPAIFEMAAPIQGESRDLHYESMGSYSLRHGESLNLPVADAVAEYLRVIDWKIPDTRDEFGRIRSDSRYQEEDEEFDRVPWNAVSFQNPFEFPMTTASATLIEGDQFQGQQRITWTNPGATTCVRITKALSIDAKSFEREVPETRKEVEVYNRNHYQVDVEGTLEVSNHRASDAVVDIQRRFSGELLSADGEPVTELLEEGAYSVNQRNQLLWRVDVPSGEKVTLNYRYRVLVRY